MYNLTSLATKRYQHTLLCLMCVHYCVQQSQTFYSTLFDDEEFSPFKKERKYIIPSIFIVTIREKKRERERDPSGGCYRCVELARKSQLYIPAFLSLSLFFSHYVHTQSTAQSIQHTHIHIDMHGVNMFVRVCVLCIWSGEPKGSRHSRKILLSNGWNRYWTDGCVLFYFIFFFCYSSFESILHTHPTRESRE